MCILISTDYEEIFISRIDACVAIKRNRRWFVDCGSSVVNYFNEVSGSSADFNAFSPGICNLILYEEGLKMELYKCELLNDYTGVFVFRDFVKKTIGGGNFGDVFFSLSLNIVINIGTVSIFALNSESPYNEMSFLNFNKNINENEYTHVKCG